MPYARDEPFWWQRSAVVADRFENSRGSEYVERALCQPLPMAARLAKSPGANDGVTPAPCFAHVRRRLWVSRNELRLATQPVTTITPKDRGRYRWPGSHKAGEHVRKNRALSSALGSERNKE